MRLIDDKQYDKERRNPKARAFYASKEWKDLRKVVFHRDNMICQRCMEKGIVTAGDVVHHIIYLLDGENGWNNRLNELNLITLCHKCHNFIHAGDKVEESEFMQSIYFDENGFPRKIEKI